MTRPLQVGIIGAGRMVSIHAGVLSSVAEVDVVTVVDSRTEAAATLAKTIGAMSFTSPEEAIAFGGLEAVLIATPSPSHPRLVESALRAGLHVLCEKPLSLDASPDAQLAELAALNDRVLQVGFWRRFSPPWVEAKRLIDAGAIGEPLTIRLAQWDANPPPAEFCDPKVSGGRAIDCGVHEYDLAEWLTGLGIRSVTAKNLPVVDRKLGEAGDVDNLVALLDLEGGVVAPVDLTRNARYGDDVRTEILGAAGAIFVDLLPTGRRRIASARCDGCRCGRPGEGLRRRRPRRGRGCAHCRDEHASRSRGKSCPASRGRRRTRQGINRRRDPGAIRLAVDPCTRAFGPGGMSAAPSSS